MAAFTTFSIEALERYIYMFNIGELHAHEPIESGIENSNYFVTIDRDGEFDEFVLTITESLDFNEVPFFNDLFVQLDRSGLPVPNPLHTLDGMSSTIFCGKPAWLFPRLPGEHPEVVSPDQCDTIGTAIATLHGAADSARYTRPNPYDVEWAETNFNALAARLDAPDRSMLESILAEHRSVSDSKDLPRGIIHGDLFKDNTLFVGDELTGIIDFYHACDDFLAQDLAIAINEWCTDQKGETVEALESALVSGYESVRPLDPEERQTLLSLRRIGGMRFVLTRLLSGDDEGHLKDPEEFLRILRSLGPSG
jgi:homoserine kinase type II